MHFRRPLFASLLLSAAFLAPASAQMLSDTDVTVNPGAIGRGYLLYPGGKFGRLNRSLLQPGEHPGAPIQLHMPTHHREAAVHPRKPAQVAALPPAAAPASTQPPSLHTRPPAPASTPPSPPPSAPPVRTASTTPRPAPVTSDINALPEDSATRLLGANTIAVPPKPPAKPPAKPAAPATAGGSAAIPFTFGTPVAPTAPPQQTASIAPPPASSVPPPQPPSAPANLDAGLKKQSMIPFPTGASSPSAGDVNAIHGLAATLNAALAAGATRVQLQAYGGPRGDKSSDSRRLSLKRALVVRELLIEDGVPSEKIDVRAMGGADDGGASDRVDVLLRG